MPGFRLPTRAVPETDDASYRMPSDGAVPKHVVSAAPAAPAACQTPLIDCRRDQRRRQTAHPLADACAPAGIAPRM